MTRREQCGVTVLFCGENDMVLKDGEFSGNILKSYLYAVVTKLIHQSECFVCHRDMF